MGVNYQRALILYQQSRWELAEKELRQELSSEPDSSEAHTLLALCLTKRKAYADATEAAERAISLYPDSSFAHYGLAKVFLDRDRYPEAAEAALEAIRLAPDSAIAYGLLAMIRFEQREWAQSLEAADTGLQLDPEDTGCKNLRAMALVKLGRRIEAGETIESALAREPESSLTHANQGWVMLEARNYSKAMEHFRESLRLNPENEWARRGIVESLKAQNFIYGLMLRYFLFMSRLTRKWQVAILLGAYFGQQALRQAARDYPAYAPYIWVVLILYIAFAFLCWLADPLFNLILRLNKTGRLALSRDQIAGSNWVGAGLLLALGWAVAWLVTQDGLCTVAALFYGFLLIPLSGTVNISPGKPRLLMALYTAGLYALGTYLLWLLYAADNAPNLAQAKALGSSISTLIPVFTWGVFLSQFVVNGLNMITIRK